MKSHFFTVIAVIVGVGVFTIAAIEGAANGRARHCEEILEGVAVRPYNGPMVCLRKDALLKVYR